MAPSIEVLAIQAEQIRNQVNSLSAHIDTLFSSHAIDATDWAFCNAYLHSCQTPLGMVARRLAIKVPAAVAADPRA